jgi:magnesium and cobalt transporter
MNDDNSKPPSTSWLDKISQFINSEPKDRDELLDVFQTAADNTLINNDSLAMLEGVVQVSDMQARDIMIPRSQMVVIEKGTDLQGILDTVTESSHSRFPVIGEDRDDVIGILLAKDLLKYFKPGKSTEGTEQHLMGSLRQAVVVPESKRLDVLLKEFRINRNHMAIVVDEYGGVSGLVTIEDILEEIVGEIEDETDVEQTEQLITEIAPNKWLVLAQIEIDEFNQHFDVAFGDAEYDTLGGLLLQSFGHLPSNGETIAVENFQFTVNDADNRRVNSVHVSKIELDEDENIESTQLIS